MEAREMSGGLGRTKVPLAHVEKSSSASANGTRGARRSPDWRSALNTPGSWGWRVAVNRGLPEYAPARPQAYPQGSGYVHGVVRSRRGARE